MNQTELIKQMSDEELKRQLLLSQSIFFLISIILSFFLFSNISDWLHYISFDFKQIVLIGVLPALAIVLIEVILYVFVPARYFDDGGINEKVFRNQSIGSIFLISIVVAIAEESLFRGVIQTSFGYIFASVLFVLVHFRYLKKPVLLTLVIIVSFLIGYLFEITENILVVIAFHFMVDFLLGIFIKFQK
ncbi:MAG TPA: CPBP family intramembrane glutamic endopeptidase [Pseudogracilibacillus sp.]|nr:CPBP family intramembrane glutamic endopeptidase [Pseudogracilibacillus sp.]